LVLEKSCSFSWKVAVSISSNRIGAGGGVDGQVLVIHDMLEWIMNLALVS
jgi:ketopantoate hydroxymethyltransferase